MQADLQSLSGGFSDDLPVAPPTPAAVEAMVEAMGGDAERLECRVPPRCARAAQALPGMMAVLPGKEDRR